MTLQGKQKTHINPTEQVYLKGTNSAIFHNISSAKLIASRRHGQTANRFHQLYPGTTTQVTTDASGNIVTTIGWTNPSPEQICVVLDLNGTILYTCWNRRSLKRHCNNRRLLCSSRICFRRTSTPGSSFYGVR